MSVNNDIIITASAGTGKTYRLVNHYLMAFDESFRKRERLDVHNVLCITFTKKAAREMKERIVSEIDSRFLTSQDRRWQELRGRMPFSWISTIHSFCERLLRESALHLSLDPGFEVVTGMDYYTKLTNLVRSYFEEHIDELGDLLKYTGIDNAMSLLRASLTRHRYEVLSSDPLKLSRVCSNSQNKSLLAQKAHEVYKEHSKRLFQLFRSEFTQANELDFDELLLMTRDLLKDHPDVQERYSERFRYILVDEFQDTDTLQTEIINLLHVPSKNYRLFVGDPKQSIYAFRGADVSVFNKTQEEFYKSGLLTETLDTNYRSRSELVEFQNALFSLIMPKGVSNEYFRTSYLDRVKAHKEKTTDPSKHVKLLLSDNTDDSDNVAAFVSQLLGKTMVFSSQKGREAAREVQPQDIAILLRKFTRVSSYENSLNALGIPFFTSGSRGFFERSEVNGILSWLEFLADPLDDSAFIRLSMSPAFRLSLDQLFSLKRGYDHFIQAIFDDRYQGPELLKTMLMEHRELKHVTRPGVLVEKFIAESNYMSRLAVLPDADRMTANTLKLVDMIKELERRKSGLRDLLASFRSTEDFSEEPEAALEAESSNSIKIMTVHQSKGLEFPIVIVGDCFWQSKALQTPFVTFDNNSFAIVPREKKEEPLPQEIEEMKLLENEKQYEEEKRTLYVALTRARDLLAISLNGLPTDGKPWSKMLKNTLYDPEDMTISQSVSDYIEIITPDARKLTPGLSAHESITRIDTSLVDPIADPSLGKYISPTRLMAEHPEYFELEEFFEFERNTLKAKRDTTAHGNLAHKILEELGRQRKGLSAATLDEIVESYSVPDAFEDTIDEADRQSVFSKLLALSQHPLIMEIMNSERVFSEISVQRRLEDFILQGVIDKLYSIDSTWRIIDFKYANRNLAKEKMHSFQLEFYVYLLKDTLDVERATVIYLKSGETMEVHLSDAREFERLLKELIYRRGGVLDET